MQVIEFTGTPKSGKTALIKRLVKHFENNGAFAIYDGFRTCPFRESEGAYYEKQLWTIVSVVKKILEYKNSRDKPKYLFIDRGLFDQRIFLEFLKNKGAIDKKQHSQLLRILNPLLPPINKVINFTTDPKTSHKRQLEGNKKPRFSLNEVDRLNKIAFQVLPKDTIQLDGSKTKEELMEEIISEIGRA